MILEVPPHHGLEPLYRVREGLVQSLSQRRSNFFQLGCHALANGLSMDDKVAGPLVRPTDVSETQKVKGLRSSFAMRSFRRLAA